ncbi:MAG: DUF5666 domain-containing protein [Acidobacteriaceae bacterium]|nr:DUF5666 domain-containing protein [Acidobacteriaceae bacterium]
MLFACALALSLPVFAQVAPPFRGFVTSIDGPDSFFLSKSHVICNAKTKLDEQGSKHHKSPFTMDKLHLGTYVEVAGRLEKNGFVTAKLITIHAIRPGDLKGEGIVEYKPTDNILWLDGYPLRVTPQTKVFLNEHPSDTSALQLNMRIGYLAHRNSDGTIDANELDATPETVTADEQEYFSKVKLKVTPPDYANNKPGIVDLPLRRNKYILPDEEVTQWVNKIATSLLPESQTTLADDDPRKISVKVYVLNSSEKSNETTYFANGYIFIPDRALLRLHTSSEVAGLLSTDLTAFIEKTWYIHHKRILAQNMLTALGVSSFTYPLALGNDIDRNRFLLRLENEINRTGLVNLDRAGYNLTDIVLSRVYGIEYGMNPGYPLNPAPYETSTPDQVTASIPDQETKLMLSIQLDHVLRANTRPAVADNELKQIKERILKVDPKAGN